MHLDAPWALLILFAIPITIYLHFTMTGRGSLRFATTQHAKQVKRSWRQKWILLPLALRILALIILVIAIARPQEGKEQVRDISKGIAIEMVVDRSGSMGAEMNYEGRQLSRLEVVKRVFEEFVSGKGDLAGRPNDLIGLITFARFADTVAPLTLAHGAITQFLQNLHLVKREEEDGTAIGDAIALAAARLKKAEESLQQQSKQQQKSFEIKSKIIILLTDGQSNMGKRTPLQAAALAKKWGIKIYTIGVGSNEALMRQQGILGSFLVRAGASVDKQTLAAVAKTTDGIFRMAEDADSLRAIYQEIDAMERSEIESIRYLDYQEQFQPFLLFVLALIIAEMLLSSTIFRKIP